ncbi:MAG: hypothetical protein ABSH37_18880, partial [Bryobacteraceae bacterium]
MDFHQKYELIEPLPGEGPKSFRARQSGFQRDVTVHFLVGGPTPENQALMARLRALPPSSMARLIEVGTGADGTQFVVTFAPPFQHLVDWLRDQEGAAVDTQKFSRAGAWKVPVSPPAAAATVPPTEPAQPGAFEDMFRTAQPMPTGQMMAAPGAQPPPARPPVASKPEESTRLFQTAAVPTAAPAPPASANIPQPPLAPEQPKPQPPAALPAAPLAPPPASPPVPAAPVPPPAASEPGEFTRLFQTVPAAAPAATAPLASPNIPQPPLAPEQPKPQPPAAAPPAPPPDVAAPVPPPVASEPGEFTRLFQTVPAAAPAAAPASANIPQ